MLSNTTVCTTRSHFQVFPTTFNSVPLSTPCKSYLQILISLSYINMASIAQWRIATVVLSYFTAYCLQPLLADVIKFNGAAHSSTFLILLPHYYSMILVGFLPTEKKLSQCDWRRGLLVSSLDILNQLLKKGGLVFSGAAVYTVVDSSSIIWTAIWSKILLNKHISKEQWISLILISVGLSLKAFQLNFSWHDEEFFGVVLISLASVLMGLTFVLNEKYMKGKDAIEGPNIVCMMGIICSITLTIWTFCWTLPQYDQLVTLHIQEKKGNITVIIFSFICLFLSGFLHSSTFWYIMREIGALSAGVLKGLKVATVFIVSHFLFCELQPNQCLNAWTGLSAAVCVVGVILYTIATSNEVTASTSEEEAFVPLLSDKAANPVFEGVEVAEGSTGFSSPDIPL